MGRRGGGGGGVGGRVSAVGFGGRGWGSGVGLGLGLGFSQCTKKNKKSVRIPHLDRPIPNVLSMHLPEGLGHVPRVLEADKPVA